MATGGLLLGGAGHALDFMGNRKRAQAMDSALANMGDVRREHAGAIDTSQGVTAGALGGMGQQRNAAMDALLGTTGAAPIRGQEQNATSVLGDARSRMRGMMRPTFNPMQGGSNRAAFDQSAALAGVNDPRTDLMSANLAHVLAQPGIAKQQSQYGDTMGTLDRTRGETIFDQDMRQQELDRIFGVRSDAASEALRRSQFAGGLENALGGLMVGTAPGLGAYEGYKVAEKRDADDGWLF